MLRKATRRSLQAGAGTTAAAAVSVLASFVTVHHRPRRRRNASRPLHAPLGMTENTGPRTWKACASDSNRDSKADSTCPRLRESTQTAPRSTDGYGRVQQPCLDLLIRGSRSRTGSHSGSQIAQPSPYDRGRTRSTDCGSGREGRPDGPLQTPGRDLRIRRPNEAARQTQHGRLVTRWCAAFRQVLGPRLGGSAQVRTTFRDAFGLRKHDVPQGIRPEEVRRG
jgi:hypothetical protein